MIHGNSQITLYFGKELGGFVTLSLSPSSPNISLSLAFTAPISDDSAITMQNQSHNGALRLHTPLPTAQ
ncbi:hypothetical protein M422DRAFT_252946 [Sphaerobolus stellatus SS14]|uniref:Uncharacterized protein n=1 Tax=Sphaerobolus stellatus (strain SS14) TaxID=990650 RepID=A0A0C9VNS4_SPHS4|nr:hypothetical protein M422DRAFT_252946 [Sphaerobolus stellatus SS14]